MMEIILAFLAGLLIGSFLNVCIFRLPRDLSVVAPRSFCPVCVQAAEDRGVPLDKAMAEGTIAPYDLVPVVSYAILGGRCRRCKTKISVRYPIVELATAAAFAACVGYFGVTLLAAKYAVYSAIMIALIMTDFEERILPDEFTLGGIGLGLVVSFFVPMPPDVGTLLALYFKFGPLATSIFESVLGAAVGSGLIWFLGWAYEKIRHREGLGFGDVKMIGAVGAWMGLSAALLTLTFAALIGSILGGGYILLAKKQASTFELPFGSFLGVAALAVAAYGEIVLKWYSIK